ncbi:cilia- and flagella-associated protein 299-like [Periplaneta americana]|uniref:cilia- and flagella-associated protein 299-like n=1 Tax=Periplaneta americana TaxID=6978 RepID=UPI0037E90166
METILNNVIEGDKKLLRFSKYEEYLDSLVAPMDLYYLRSRAEARNIAELGYKSTEETLTKEQFYTRLSNVTEATSPTRRPYKLAGANLQSDDQLLQELALRERPNREGLLATIIFIRIITKKGSEISGYIDYAQRLKTEDWLPIFQGRRLIKPRHTDLSFYNWRKGVSTCNSSINFEAIACPTSGLMFQCRNDRKNVCVDPRLLSPGSNSSRITVKSDVYEQVVLYDHVLRRKD